MFYTQRLLLRKWKDTDLSPFSEINKDPKVLEFLPGPLTDVETAEFIHRIQVHFQEFGFGLWAVELKGTGEFIGYVGLSVPGFKAHFTPCVEIGWRLSPPHWRKGYATEAATKVLEIGFSEFSLAEIVSFTVPENHRSIQVMEKIGMTRNQADDFCHPKLPAGHQFSRHLLYRIQKSPK